MSPRESWYIDVRHEGLGKFRRITGSDSYVVEQKAADQLKTWEVMWNKKVEVENNKKEKENAAKDREAKKQLAIIKTEEAQKALEQIGNTLIFTLNIDDTIDWEKLKDLSSFDIPKPEELKIPKEPKSTDTKYQLKLSILDKLFSSRKEKKIEKSVSLFKNDHKKWENEKEELIKKNENELKKWENEKKIFLEKQKKKNEAVKNKKEEYFHKSAEAIIDYCDMVLANSIYPDAYPQQYDIDYNPESKIFIVEYSLPSPDIVPKLKEIKYIQSKDEFNDVYISDAAFNKMYDDLLYKITLRSIHELFEADVINAIDSIIFNGWVKSIDKATGNEVNACIISIQANKEEFLQINLANVDPKLCFKKLKGIGSSKLHGLASIRPILKINREDTRFISPYDVVDSIDESENIAAMPWEDFEHLIRELFEKEFTKVGGEVKITQASRDGGVDAIAFDPDPIRGGKIVIQAKRYTNIVEVSAVRDLYGTIVNEGATKGILVTTADFGPNSYDFAKDKPITLLNGSNLLHLLEKHGHKAKIDLKEAKRIIAEQE